jgi:copper(I)-binding protein
MRKVISRLSIPAEDTLRLDPFSGHLFVFCNLGLRTPMIPTASEKGAARR